MPEVVSLVSWVLWILSFRLGTLLLCGRLSLDWKWPFIRKFSEISLEKREQIFRNWTREKSWVALRVVFVLIKLFCFYNFFSRVRFFIIFSKLEFSIWLSSNCRGVLFFASFNFIVGIAVYHICTIFFFIKLSTTFNNRTCLLL